MPMIKLTSLILSPRVSTGILADETIGY